MHAIDLYSSTFTVLFKLVVQGLREIEVSYCVHNVTTGECLLLGNTAVVTLCTQ